MFVLEFGEYRYFRVVIPIEFEITITEGGLFKIRNDELGLGAICPMNIDGEFVRKAILDGLYASIFSELGWTPPNTVRSEIRNRNRHLKQHIRKRPEIDYQDLNWFYGDLYSQTRTYGTR